MPVTGAALLIGMLAVTGSPPFSMFQSEFIILRAAFDGSHFASAFLFIIFVVAIFIGFLWHIGRLVLGPGSGGATAELSRWKEMPVIVLSSVLLVAGFWLPYRSTP
jgi:hydrogenase-4 component F